MVPADLRGKKAEASEAPRWRGEAGGSISNWLLFRKRKGHVSSLPAQGFFYTVIKKARQS